MDDRPQQTPPRERLQAEVRHLRRRRQEILDSQTSVGAPAGGAGWLDSYTFEHRRNMNAQIAEGQNLSEIEARIREIEDRLHDSGDADRAVIDRAPAGIGPRIRRARTMSTSPATDSKHPALRLALYALVALVVAGLAGVLAALVVS